MEQLYTPPIFPILELPAGGDVSFSTPSLNSAGQPKALALVLLAGASIQRSPKRQQVSSVGMETIKYVGAEMSGIRF